MALRNFGAALALTALALIGGCHTRTTQRPCYYAQPAVACPTACPTPCPTPGCAAPAPIAVVP